MTGPSLSFPAVPAGYYPCRPLPAKRARNPRQRPVKPALAGRRARLVQRVATPSYVLPVGTLGTITSWGNGVGGFLADPCPCCACQRRIPRLLRDDFELIEGEP